MFCRLEKTEQGSKWGTPSELISYGIARGLYCFTCPPLLVLSVMLVHHRLLLRNNILWQCLSSGLANLEIYLKMYYSNFLKNTWTGLGTCKWAGANLHSCRPLYHFTFTAQGNPAPMTKEQVIWQNIYLLLFGNPQTVSHALPDNS